MTEWAKTKANAKYDSTPERRETWENIQNTFPDNFSSEDVHDAMKMLDSMLSKTWVSYLTTIGDKVVAFVARLSTNAGVGDLRAQYPNVFKRLEAAGLYVEKPRPKLTEDRLREIEQTRKLGAAMKAKCYDEHVGDLVAEVRDLGNKLQEVQVDPERLSKLKVAAKIDPNHLQRLLALEKAVCEAGYCGMPTAG